jgi:hypothetical protein
MRQRAGGMPPALDMWLSDADAQNSYRIVSCTVRE